MLEYNDNVHIYPEKTAASYDNRRTAILSVFVVADGGAGVGIHTTVHILNRVSGTGNRPPIPMDRVPDCQLSIICWHLNLPPKLSSNPNPNPCNSKKTPLAYQSFHFFEAFRPNSTWDHFMRHAVGLQQIVYKCCIHLPKLNFRAKYNA